MEIDNDTLELLESRLGDKVETRVRRRLFGIYGAAATAFLAAFGYLGYDTVTTARTAIEKGNAEMQETIVSLRQKAEQYAQDAVADSVASAREAAEDAQQVADTAATRLNVIDEWMAARTLRLAEIEGNVAATLGKVESVTGRI